ncbi:MAG: hypothetical protein RL653_1982 [Pseudomonadota bacterium]
MPPPPPRRRPTSVGNAPAPGRGPAAPAPAPAAGPVLECTEGPAAGQVFPLEADEYVVGRSREATLSVPDNSVSRKHAKVLRSGGGWAVEDLGSGNGTLVNGEKIASETYLYSGDTIKLGDTVFTFKDESNATVARPPPTEVPTLPPRPARGGPPARLGDAAGVDTGLMNSVPPPRRMTGVAPRPEVRPRMGRGAAAPAANPRQQRIVLVAAGVVLLLVVVGAALWKKQNQAEVESAAKRRAAVVEKVEAFRLVLREGKSLVAARKWGEARARFGEAQARFGEIPEEVQAELREDRTNLETYLDRASKEIPNQVALEAADKALSEKKLLESEESLKRVTEDTAMDERVRELRTRQKALLAEYLSDARNASQGTGASLDRAKELTDDILKLEPDNRDARVINENALKAIAARSGGTYVPVKQPTGPGPAVPVMERYKQGDLTGAVAMADECAGKGDKRCRELASQVRDAQALFKQVESMDAKQLERLLGLDRSITGGGLSPMGRQAGTQAGTKFFKLAASNKAAGKFAEAATWAQKALEADPDNAGARALLADMRGKCKETYMLGYSLKDTQPEDALVQLRQAVQLCSPGDEYQGKAKRLVQALEQGPQ